MSSKAMQARVMTLESNDPQSFIVILINFDCSSKLCFEEKSNSVICDKFFKRSPIDFFRCSHCFRGQMSFHAIPAKSAENFITWAKTQRKSENQGCFKVSEKVSNINTRKWVFWKSKNVTHHFQIFIYKFSPKSKSSCNQRQKESIAKSWVCKRVIWSSLEEVLGARCTQARARHTQAGAWRT